MFKKLIAILLVVLLFSNCLVLKIHKDSPPVINYGAPLIGHYQNGDIAKGIFYIVLFASAVVGLILFSPTSDGGIIPLDRNIADPLFYSFLGASLTVPIASSIDTAATYHMINNKLLELNGIKWDPKVKHPLTKYETIVRLREDEGNQDIKDAELQRLENYKNEIERYRQKLLNGTITEDELLFISNSTYIKKQLENEIGYYNINKEKENGQK